MTRKRVIFHIGAHKTGTTYLQSLFSKHYKQLNTAGVDYPFPEAVEVIETGTTVGNVIKILYQHGLIKQDKNAFKMQPLAMLWNEKCCDKLVEIANDSKYQTILYSSEGVSALDEEDLKLLHEKFSQHFDIEFVLLIRDPFDFAYSAWRQIVKAGLSLTKFDDYIQGRLDDYRPDHRGKRPNRRLQKFSMFSTSEALIDNSMTCKIINYDSFRKDLGNKFLELCNIDAHFDLTDSKQKTALINRSFSPSEAEIQSIVNNEFVDTQFPAYFRTKLLSRADYSPSQKSYYNRELDEAILKKFHPLISKINECIIGDELRVISKDTATTSSTIEPEDVQTLVKAIKFIESIRATKISLPKKITHYIRTIRLKNIPFDFDPQAYVELNSDVAISGIDPYTHYSENGYLEGRPYRYY